MIHHDIDRVFQLKKLAFDIDSYLLGQIAVCHGGRHGCNVAYLRREISGHEVDIFGQISPCARDTFDLRLTAELPFGPNFTCHPRHFRSESAKLIDHRVHGFSRT